MKFYIDISYVTSVTVTTEYKPRQRDDETEADFLVRILSSSSTPVTSTTNKDHPKFTALRERLCTEGYIRIERSWWNGDRVIKPFELNDVKFEPDDKFPCAAAMTYTLQHGIP